MKYIFNSQDDLDVSRFGGKAGALHRLAESDLPIPEWFVVDPAAFFASIDPANQSCLQEGDWEQIATALADIHPCSELLQQLSEALDFYPSEDERFAVRSSALDEDGSVHSFAGQLESYLYVPRQEVADRVADVWRSGFSERVISYRKEAGLSEPPSAPAVLVQRMVASEASGVAFGIDPVSGKRDHCVISAVHGVGSALVSGEADGDTWRVDGQGRIVDYRSVELRSAHRFDEKEADYLRLEPVSEYRPPLSDEQVGLVADLVRQASEWFGVYQDIEWAFARGRLYLLQSRPITALSDLPDPDGERTLWDNSNIVESYGGITTPLTFSFARRAYESVYREFCRILGVSESVIEANDTTFRRMLGLIRGRVYYNLISWYRVLAMLPGFTVNRRFMEQMMGVKEGLPEEIVAELGRGSTGERLRDGLRLAGTCLGLVVNHFLLPRKIRLFYKRLNDALQEGEKLDEMDAGHLCNHYHDLERKLLTRWDAPLINDFFAMIFYGVLRKLCLNWCHDRDESLQNDLLAGEGGMISAEPAKRVRKLAQIIIEDLEMIRALRESGLVEIMAMMAVRTEFEQEYRAYLVKFGDRCLDELKLESQTLHDDPLLLLRSIGHLAERLRSREGRSPETGHDVMIREAAEKRVRDALEGKWLRRIIFRWVLKHARNGVRERENLRFERTRLFGRVRRIFLSLGKHLRLCSLLNDPRDIFYLEVDEALGFVEGTVTTTDLNALVELRRREFAGYEQMEPPADRFETVGMVHQGNLFRGADAQVEPGDGDLQGIGCCPGVVRGPVRVVLDPRNVELQAGEILVAERTDPGWIMLFPASTGILVERGSLLSHSAIVAREMGIPAIVSVSGITKVLKDGDWVEFDGASGVIRRLEKPQEGESNA